MEPDAPPPIPSPQDAADPQGAPEPQCAPDPLSSSERSALRQTVHEINTGLFFEAHETLELAWTHCEASYRLFLQAIIHVAVGCHHGTNGNRLGMERQFTKAIRKLDAYRPVFAGIETELLQATLRKLLLQSRDAQPWAAEIALPLVHCVQPGNHPKLSSGREIRNG